MTADAHTHAKGWYVDPDDLDSLRYWDGKGWTEQRRTRPSWGGPEGTQPPSPADRARKRRRAFFAVVIVGTILCAVVWFTIPKRPPRTISDDQFRSAAAGICADTIPELRAERRPERQLSDDEVADRIDEVADKLEDVVADLRAVPVAAADEAEVQAWLAAWDGYIDVGHRYAEAIRDGDATAAEDVRREGDDEAAAIGRFASGNRIDACIPFQLG